MANSTFPEVDAIRIDLNPSVSMLANTQPTGVEPTPIDFLPNSVYTENFPS
jgi:hypothetical protein